MAEAGIRSAAAASGPRAAVRFWVVALVVATLAPLAGAQSGSPTLNQLRRENEALRQRVDQLEAQLDRSRQTIEVLTEQIEELNGEMRRLRTRLERSGGGEAMEEDTGEAAAEEPSFAEVDLEAPLASPESMIASLQATYAEALSGRAFDTDGDLGRYVREVRRWARDQRRRVRGDAEWLIEVTAVLNDDPGGVEVEYRVVDQETLLPYSERLFTLELPARVSRFFLRSADRPLWLVRGMVRAEPRVELEREEAGFFDFPAFIGPFAEFGFELEVDAMARWPREGEGEPGS